MHKGIEIGVIEIVVVMGGGHDWLLRKLQMVICAFDIGLYFTTGGQLWGRGEGPGWHTYMVLKR